MRGSTWMMLVLATALAGCDREAVAPAVGNATLPPTAAQVAEHWWVCGDVPVTTHMRGELLTLSGPFGERELVSKPCSPGNCYGDDRGNEFWNEGDAATLKLDGKDVGECKENASS